MLKWALVLGLLVGLFVGGFVVGQSDTAEHLYGAVPLLNKLDQKSLSAAPGFSATVSDLAFTSRLSLDRGSDYEQSTRAAPLPADNSDRRILAELEHQLNNVDRLRKRVATLEWETLVLESDLLAREVDLANAKKTLAASQADKTTVYNITNVPVGGYVVSEPDAAGQSSQTDLPTAADISKLNSSTQEIKRPAFFGPAPDRYENLINPGSAQTPHQEQSTNSQVREGGSSSTGN